MIVTRSWLNEWIDLQGISTDDLCKTFNAIGLEVDSVESYSVPKKIVFGKVLECEKHPDADKLNVCQVDIGTSVRQIVCGASNVRVGLDVIVATIGAEMPGGLVIKPVKLRGVDSEGMICSASEIGLPEFSKGILELDKSIGNYKLGEEVSSNSIFSDDVIEIELTANRGDCLSIRGVARDLSAAYDRQLKKQRRDEDDDNRKGIGRFLSVQHDKDLDLSLNYKVLELTDLSLPMLLKLRLAQVDETKSTDLDSLLVYATYNSGVILRAYNYGNFCEEDQVLARIALHESEEGFSSIHTPKKTASIVGVMQEDFSKVTYTEGTVIIEASYIPPDVVSKQIANHKIDTDSFYYRTSRGSEPDLCSGISDCVELLQEYSNSSIFSGSIAVGKIYNDTTINFTKQDVDDIVGADISKLQIGKILKNLGFDTSRSSADNFVISVPRYRHDIVNKQDIIEEIVRMVGIDNIPSKPFEFTEENKLKDDYYAYKKRTVFRHRAAANGFFEAVHFVFDEKKVLEKYGFETTKSELELLNPIVQTLDTLRSTLMTGLLRSASSNVRSGKSQVKLFELGSVFDELREESLKFSMIFSGEIERESISNAGKAKIVDFAGFVQKVSNIIGSFDLVENQTKHSLSHPYQSASIVVNNQVVGEIFRVHPEVEKEYDLSTTYLCELDFNKIMYQLKTAKSSSKYQAVNRDLSLIIPASMKFQTIKELIDSNTPKELINYYPVDRYSDESLGDNVSLSLRFILQSNEKTLEEEDINTIMDGVLTLLNKKLGIGLR